MSVKWQVRFSTKAKKQYEKLKKCGVRPSINDAIDFLVLELEQEGPQRINWPNYGEIFDNYHCHLKKGKPTYVACWSVLDKKLQLIEVYYVGTHEGAPY